MYTIPAKDASRVEFHDSVALAHWHVHPYPRYYSHSKNPGLLLLLQPLRLCSPSSLQISTKKQIDCIQWLAHMTIPVNPSY